MVLRVAPRTLQRTDAGHPIRREPHPELVLQFMSRDELDDVFLRCCLVDLLPIDLSLKHFRGAAYTLQSRVQYRLGFVDVVVSDGMHVIRKLFRELRDWYTVLKRRCEELC